MTDRETILDYLDRIENATARAYAENETTGQIYYDCCECWWDGPVSPLDEEKWVMRCPECDAILDARVRAHMEVAADLDED